MTHLDDNALTMLAAGETGALAAWRQRRHLKTCPPCRAQWAETERLWMLAQTLRDDAVPASLKHNTLSTLQNTLSALQKEKIPMQTTFKTSFRPRRGMATLAALAACLAAVSVALLWPGSPARPQPAFAEVERAMETVQTVHWMEQTRHYPGFGGMIATDARTEETWVRLNPPAKASRVRPGSGISSMTYPWLTTPEGTIMFNTEQKTYSVMLPDEHTRSHFLSLIYTAMFLAPSIGQPDWVSRPDTLDGRSVTRFELQWPGFPNGDGTHSTSIVWADSQTHRVVRRELHQMNGDGEEILSSVADQFRYNETLPPNLFTFRVPPGPAITDEMNYAPQTAQVKK